jgi:hypothetical protein
MNRYCSFAMAALAGTLAVGATPAGRDNARAAGAPVASALPAQSEPSEPADSVLVTLPGSRVRPAAVRPLSPKPDLPAPGDFPKPAIPKLAPESPAPVKRAPRPIFPSDFQKDSAVFCQQRIGQWGQADAYNLLGDPLRERPAYSDEKAENGRIYAFSDPTGRYRALELDFAADTGLLRTVFVYPWGMTWLECRHLWGAKVTATGTNNGKTFYSYLNHRLDVLVDLHGKVVSLGFY